jgi:copper chaperone CopZ
MNSVQPQPSGLESRIVFSKALLAIGLVLAGGLSHAGVKELDLQVDGVKCSLCAAVVQRIVGNLPGVGEVSLQPDPWRLKVTARPGEGLDLQGIRKQLAKAGYTPVGDDEISAEGMVSRGSRDHLTFKVPGAKEEYDLLEGAQLRALLQELPAGPGVRVAVLARIHRHPASLPPSLSILSYEIEANR